MESPIRGKGAHHRRGPLALAAAGRLLAAGAIPSGARSEPAGGPGATIATVAGTGRHNGARLAAVNPAGRLRGADTENNRARLATPPPAR